MLASVHTPAGSECPLASVPASSAERPRLKWGLVPLWRDAETAQLGLEPGRATIVSGLSRSCAAVLAQLDGNRTRAEIGRACGVEGDELLTLLEQADLLEDAGAAASERLSGLDDASRARTEPERAHLALVRPDDGSAGFAARRAQRVLIRGGGRIGATVAHLLAASGLGRVTVDDDARVAAGDPCPGGASPADVGLRRSAAVTALTVRALTPALDAGAPDLAIICDDGPTPPDPATWQPWFRAGIPFLSVGFRETTAIVGPLVVPRRAASTGCPECVHLHRCDRDTRWPLVAQQLAVHRERLAGTAPVALVWAAAATCVAQALAVLDCASRNRDPVLDADSIPSVGTSLELAGDGWRWRRRWWGPHPRCTIHADENRRLGA